MRDIRWMIRRDLPEVLAIEHLSFDFPWSEDDFIRVLRQRNCIGMVVDETKRKKHIVAGYMIYELHKARLHLLSLAVHPKFRRTGVGRMFVDKLKGKLNHNRRTRITLETCESNLGSLFFWKSMGFLATGLLKNFYDACDDDAIAMQYRLPVEELVEA